MRDDPSTYVHRGPRRAPSAERQAALVCAFPRSVAVPVPDSAARVGRKWLAAAGLADREVSNEHIRFDRVGGILRVADLQSRNGTWVDGVRLGARDVVTLEEGSVLRLGRTLFVVRDSLEGPLEPSPPIGDLVGPFGLRDVARFVDSLAVLAPANVLVEGETGVGKELAARALASAVARSHSFVAVNVAGVPAGLFESQLFGHVAGAFSGARGAVPGLIVAHDGGSVLLDEIGELALDLQAKLLRLLENREVLPVGASHPVYADVFVVAATNRDLEQLQASGAFRRDLFARLVAARVWLPPLRQRREDVFAIACELVRRRGGTLPVDNVEIEAVERLVLAPWPGNVRELGALLDGVRRLDPAPGLRSWAVDALLGPPMTGAAVLTAEVVEAALAATGGKVATAARQLGVTRSKVIRWLRKRDQRE